MTALPDHVPAAPAPRSEEHQALDNYVLATRVVHHAETLLPAAEGFPEALLHIEVAFAAALSITADSSWSEVRAAREHLDIARHKLDRAGYRLR